MNYGIDEHKHRFAVWAAGRAYARRGKGYTVAVAKRLIESAGLDRISSPTDLPPPDEVDALIHQRIEAVCEAARVTSLECTYGRAQKLVNIYLKSKLVCAGHHDDPSVRALHPPIDRVLIRALVTYSHQRRNDASLAEFRAALNAARRFGESWTDFDKPTYDAYVAAFKLLQGSEPLWAVEKHWRPERELSET